MRLFLTRRFYIADEIVTYFGETVKILVSPTLADIKVVWRWSCAAALILMQ